MIQALAFDTETHLIGPGEMQSPPVVCVSYAVIQDNRVTSDGVLNASDGLRLVNAAIDQGATLINAEIAYDVRCLSRRDPAQLLRFIAHYDRDLVTDVLLRQGLLDLSRGDFKKRYSLQSVAEAYGLHVEKGPDTWRLRYAELDGVPVGQWPHEAYEYARLDAVTAAQVYLAQQGARSDKFPGMDPLLDQYRQARAALALRAMSAAGMRADRDRVAAFRAYVARDRDAARDEAIAAGFVEARRKRDGTTTYHRRDKHARAFVATLPQARRTEKGTVRLDAESCGLYGPEFAAFTEFSSRGKLLTNYIDGMLAPAVEGPVHCRYTPMVATGRTACATPNLQNTPREPGVRECFAAPPGQVFVEADAPMLELFTFSQINYWVQGRSKMGDALREGFDPHCMIASEILGQPYPWVVAHKEQPAVDNARTCGKGLNFGAPGGLGARSFVGYAKSNYGIALDEPQSKHLLDVYRRTWPEVEGWFRYVRSQSREGLHAMVQPWSGRLRADCFYTDACNTGFQGLGADTQKIALWEMFKAASGYHGNTHGLYGCAPALFVHDSHTYTAPEEQAHEAATAIATIMDDAHDATLPAFAGTKRKRAEATVTRHLSKRAKPRRNAQGRLVPWDLWEAVAEARFKGTFRAKDWPVYCGA